MHPDLAQFTVARIAEVLQAPCTAVSAKLIGAPISGRAMESGRKVACYTWRALPEDLRRKIDQAAAAQGYGSGESALLYGSPDWSTVPAKIRDRAACMARALRQALARTDLLPPANLRHTDLAQVKIDFPAVNQLLDIALADYNREFKYTIHEVSLWEIVHRVLTRDAGAGRFERLHLYIPDRPTKQPEANTPADLARVHAPLKGQVELIADPMAPTADDERYLFAEVFRHLDQLDSDPAWRGRRAAVKSSLVDWLLLAVPGLSLTKAGTPSRDGLKRKLNRLYQVWLDGDRTVDAIRDKRTIYSGRTGYRCVDCEKKVHDLSIHLGRNTTRAWRELYLRGLLCEPCLARYKFDPRLNKCRVPNAVRKAATPSELAFSIWKSPRQGELAGPATQRDYSNVHPGDFFVFDDMTANEPVYERLPDGGWDLWFPQLILGVDMRSALALDFVMHKAHPHGWSIQRAFYQIFAVGAGMPRRGLYLERGVFDSNKVNSTLTAAGVDPRTFNEFRAMFDFMRSTETDERANVNKALRVIRARLPRGKTIEGDLGIWQKSARLLPGHAGFNQRMDNYDRRKDFIDLCRRGKEDPRNEGILTPEEYRLNWATLLEEYNNEVQNGHRNPGCSPQETWNNYVANHPLPKLPARLWPILASSVHEVKVRSRGVEVRLSTSLKAVYADANLGALEGQRVKVFVNIEFPEVALITDLKCARFHYIAQRVTAPAIDATKADFSRAEGLKSNFMAQAKYLAGNVQNPMQCWVQRDSDATEEAGQVGDKLTEAAAGAQSNRESGTRQRTDLVRRMRSVGLQPAAGVDLDNPRHRVAIELAIQARETIEAE